MRAVKKGLKTAVCTWPGAEIDFDGTAYKHNLLLQDKINTGIYSCNFVLRYSSNDILPSPPVSVSKNQLIFVYRMHSIEGPGITIVTTQL